MSTDTLLMYLYQLSTYYIWTNVTVFSIFIVHRFPLHIIRGVYVRIYISGHSIHKLNARCYHPRLLTRDTKERIAFASGRFYYVLMRTRIISYDDSNLTIMKESKKVFLALRRNGKSWTVYSAGRSSYMFELPQRAFLTPSGLLLPCSIVSSRLGCDGCVVSLCWARAP